MRIWLEEQWECPECRVTIVQAPFRIYPLEAEMLKIYGEWDTSKIEYHWSGLVFPVLDP
jgi:hypothetical protein